MTPTSKPQPSREDLSRYAMQMYLASDEARQIKAIAVDKRTRKSTRVLQVVAVGQTIVAIALSLMPELAGSHASPYMAGERLTVAAIFWGLVVWSHASPLAPAVIGLVGYLALWGLRGVGLGASDGSAALVFAVGTFVRLAMTLLLVQAVVVGLQHRRATKSYNGV